MSDLAILGSFDPDHFGRAEFDSAKDLPWEFVAGVGKRFKLGVGAWLAHQRLAADDGTWTEQLAGFAFDLDVNARTLDRWMRRAAEMAQVALPTAPRETKGGDEPESDEAEPHDKMSDGANTHVTFPDDPVVAAQQMMARGARWFGVLPVADLDTLIGILRAARRQALEGALGTTATEGCEHLSWRNQLTNGSGKWLCADCGADLGRNRPSRGKKVA